MTTRTLLSLVALAALLGTPGQAFGDEPGPAPGYLGFHVEPLSILQTSQRSALGATADAGNIVAALVPEGPAVRAGLKLGDLMLSLDGRDLPTLTTKDRYDPRHHEWRVAMRAVYAGIRLGRDLETVVLRGDGKLTLSLKPVDEKTMHRLQGGNDTKVAAPGVAGEPKRLQLLFEAAPGEPDGALPSGFVVDEGHWCLAPHAAAASGRRVLRQDMTVIPWAAVIAAGEGRSYTNGHAQVRFKSLSGVTDASGGIVWRAQDGKNYYVARANALEDNFRIYSMRDGVRTELASVQVTLPAFGEWHVIDVWFEGPSFRATLNGGNLVEARDETFASGYCGLWTKADSVTLFDDLEVTPLPARP